MSIEYWYDPQHTGGIRVINHDKKVIYGSDPNELTWKVIFEYENSHTLRVNFRSKQKHYSKKDLDATYKNMKNEVHWSDGNIWRRIRIDPRIVLSYSEK